MPSEAYIEYIQKIWDETHDPKAITQWIEEGGEEREDRRQKAVNFWSNQTGTDLSTPEPTPEPEADPDNGSLLD